jgi:Icc-related predicted phosphoesterase
MIFIGDVHGKIPEYLKIINSCDKSIQLGDFGVGFIKIPWNKISLNHRFIRGNHDNPFVCGTVKNFLGDYGYLAEEEVFFVSGAYSIDKHLRVEGRDWWKEEELTIHQMSRCWELYASIKPKIVVSHDCPRIFVDTLWPGDLYRNPTNQLLQTMYEDHQPELWVFAHHHEDHKLQIGNTLFVGLGELSIYESKNLKGNV